MVNNMSVYFEGKDGLVLITFLKCVKRFSYKNAEEIVRYSHPQLITLILNFDYINGNLPKTKVQPNPEFMLN